YSTTAATARPRTSRSSLITRDLIIRVVSFKKGQSPPRAPGVFDEGVLEVQLHNLDVARLQRFEGRPLPRAEADEHQLAPRADLPVADHAVAGRHFWRLPAELDDHLPHGTLEVLHRAIDAEHAVHQDADAVGHALDITENVRAEQD